MALHVLETHRPPHLLTVEEFMTLDTASRTELLGGFIYDVSPRNEPHRYAVRKLNEALAVGVAGRYIVQVQDAVAVSGWQGRDAPEIDVAVLTDKFYKPGPTAADAFAFIEVADTTYDSDRETNIPLYVGVGVPAWLVNIPLRQVEFYGTPADLQLRNGRVFAEGERFEVVGVPIAVSDLFALGESEPIAS